MIYFQSLTQAELAELLKPLSRPARRGQELDPKRVESQARYRAKRGAMNDPRLRLAA